MAHQIAQGLCDGGYDVTMNYPGDKLTYKVSDYQIVVFGAATYAGKPSKALTDYLSDLKDLSSSKIVLYSTGSVPDDRTEFKIMDKALGGVKPYKIIKFDTNKKSANEKTAYDFGKELAK